ncbi:MAG: hypothetical protein KA144_07160 [Xanthomonadaceae bacterium]|nr:hypothetical protein [Xanthomonadaceae bacterium]
MTAPYARKSAPLLCSALMLALLATGCQKDAAEEAEAASAEAAAADAATAVAEPAVAEPVIDEKVAAPEPPKPVPGTDAVVIEDRSTPIAAAPTFDAKAFAGRYADGGTALEVTAEGTYVLTIDGNTVDGTWTMQKGGKKITLDPNSKGENDRKLEVVSADSVNLDGATLKRSADKQ